MGIKMEKCIFCDSGIIEEIHIHNRDAFRIKCPLCSNYIISWEAAYNKIIDQVSLDDRKLFSAYLRNNSNEYNPINILSKDILQIPEIVAPYRRLSVIDKTNKIIFYLAESSKSGGAVVSLNWETDYTRFYCRGHGELRYIWDYLKETGIIKENSQPHCTVLTFEGWKKYEALKEVNKDSKRVFVAMSFDDSLKYIFKEAIYPACKECGFKAFRVDSKEHNEKICDKIIADIRSSRFIVADFTGQKHGVYFESGFARGLGLEVIWTCKKDEGKQLNFDTRQYKHILWEDAEDLKVRLINSIRANIIR